jgi:hypothetical protein
VANIGCGIQRVENTSLALENMDYKESEGKKLNVRNLYRTIFIIFGSDN